MTEITQADRDLFIQINDIRDFDDVSVQRINEGRWFTHEVELIARHREQAEQETVAKIVAWLRGFWDGDDDEDFKIAANAIEAGEWK